MPAADGDRPGRDQQHLLAARPQAATSSVSASSQSRRIAPVASSTSRAEPILTTSRRRWRGPATAGDAGSCRRRARFRRRPSRLPDRGAAPRRRTSRDAPRRLRRRRQHRPAGRAAASARRSAAISSARQRVDLVEHDELRLVDQPAAIGGELGPHRAHRRRRRRPGCRRSGGSAPGSARRGRGSGCRGRRPDGRPSIRPGMSASTNSSSPTRDDAQRRLQRRERDSRRSSGGRAKRRRETSTCRRWAARSGRHRRAASAAGRWRVPRPDCPGRRGAAPGWSMILKRALPQTAATAACDHHSLAPRHQIGEQICLSSLNTCVPTGTRSTTSSPSWPVRFCPAPLPPRSALKWRR